MLFTVVITTYNRVNLLRRAIESACNQTVDCEILVVDDCSADETEAFVKSLGNKVVYHRHQANLGHAATVNDGVLKSRGEWIKFLDDDDYLAPHCLEEMAKAIKKHPEAVICSCVAAQVESNGVELSKTPRFGPGLAYYTPQADIHYGMLLDVLPFGTPVQVACRRDVFMETGGWDSTFNTNCDDIDSWIRISQFGDAIFLNQCLAYRTMWSGAFNQKISLSERLTANVAVKQKIYALVNEKYRSSIPKFEEITAYLQLHWLMVAVKQRNLKGFLSLMDMRIFSLNAWKILCCVLIMRRCKLNKLNIRKIVLY
ncbi:glycosyl transferase, family 2 [Richelia sinica FACHB-800]|uniref:Glycosyl transferase, family 2 n=1 Tax=Richelia sinica FACHB-800 TaxID=1357546 RepID=A0A975TB10_9NOST|nr:glycosyltransferase family 2 protein [Richelia sinica]MBD2664543.1 glycosyltransferase family 2 protein [Richelia sinica FACHB-800]QXE25160.1 glycosyl transferase, family 2 [Richelia sinica FACHB-800]